MNYSVKQTKTCSKVEKATTTSGEEVIAIASMAMKKTTTSMVKQETTHLKVMKVMTASTEKVETMN